MSKALIVKFGERKYSFKTKDKCFYCRGMFWSSEQKLRDYLAANKFEPLKDIANYNDYRKMQELSIQLKII